MYAAPVGLQNSSWINTRAAPYSPNIIALDSTIMTYFSLLNSHDFLSYHCSHWNYTEPSEVCLLTATHGMGNPLEFLHCPLLCLEGTNLWFLAYHTERWGFLSKTLLTTLSNRISLLVNASLLHAWSTHCEINQVFLPTLAHSNTTIQSSLCMKHTLSGLAPNTPKNIKSFSWVVGQTWAFWDTVQNDDCKGTVNKSSLYWKAKAVF